MDQFEKFYTIALKFLSYRPRSTKEVRDKLLKKKTPSEIIEKIILKLIEQRFLNDEEFVKWWIEQRAQFKPRSMRVIKMELKQKGITQDIIESGIKNYELGGQTDLEQAKKLVQKRIQRYKNLPKQEIYQKLGRFLASKGFNWDTIKEAIDSDLIGVDEVIKERV